MNHNELLDPNLYKNITRCYINKRRHNKSEIFVYYSDGSRDIIWTFDHNRHDIDGTMFIGKTKIAAVFYCDRKLSRGLHLL